mgnify:CR=1 FL=1
MVKCPVTTVIVTEENGLNFYDALCIFQNTSNKKSDFNVVFFEKDEKYQCAVPGKEDYTVVADKRYGDNFSRNSILLHKKDETTYCISFCADKEIFRHFTNLVKSSSISENYRYIIVCRPFLVASLMHDIENLGFVFLPTRNRDLVKCSTDYILHKVNNNNEPNFLEKPPKQIRIIEENRVVFSTELDFVCPFTLFGFQMLEGHVREYAEYAEISGVKNKFVMYGPYISLPPGDYRVGFQISSAHNYRKPSVLFDVVVNLKMENSVTSVISGNAPQWVWLEFHVGEENNNNIEFRIKPQTRDTFQVHKIAVRSHTRVN